MVKRLFKSKIFLCILTVLITGTVSVYAVTYFPSNQVTYDNKTSGLKSSDVQGAIDELYNTCSSAVSSGDYLYYVVNNASMRGNTPSGSLVRITLDGKNETILSQVYNGYTIDSVYITNDYIYYTVNNANITTGQTSSGSLVRITLGGKNETTLSQVYNGYTIDSVYITNDYIYYTVNNANITTGQTSSGSLVRITLGGKNETTLSQVYNGYTIDSIFIK